MSEDVIILLSSMTGKQVDSYTVVSNFPEVYQDMPVRFISVTYHDGSTGVIGCVKLKEEENGNTGNDLD